MIKTFLPFDIHSSAIVIPVYGAIYCKGAGSDADADTIVVYFIASCFAKLSTICEMVDDFCPIAT